MKKEEGIKDRKKGSQPKPQVGETPADDEGRTCLCTEGVQNGRSQRLSESKGWN